MSRNLNIWHSIKDWFLSRQLVQRLTMRLASARSSGWRARRTAHLLVSPCCVACGTEKDLAVHHILPFHCRPDLELAEDNLLTLCSACHYIFGHLKDWKSWNATVIADTEEYRKKRDQRPTLKSGI